MSQVRVSERNESKIQFVDTARELVVGRITLDEVRGSYQSWRSHLIRSNAELRLRAMDKQFNKIVKENKNGSI